MTLSKEMMAALEADGEKLRQLTGEDHGPMFLPDKHPECQGYCLAARNLLEGKQPCPDCDYVDNSSPARMSRALDTSRLAWTREEDQALVAFWSRGLFAKQIAAQMGRSIDSIKGRARVLCLPNRRLPLGEGRIYYEFRFHATDSMRYLIKERAREEGLNMSQWVRKCIEEYEKRRAT